RSRRRSFGAGQLTDRSGMLLRFWLHIPEAAMLARALAPALLAALVAGCAGSGSPSDPEPEETLGPIEAMSPPLRLGGLAGLEALGQSAPIATVDGAGYPSWIVMLLAGAEPVTVTREGVVTELLPAGDGRRFVFLRVRADGTISRAVDAP